MISSGDGLLSTLQEHKANTFMIMKPLGENLYSNLVEHLHASFPVNIMNDYFYGFNKASLPVIVLWLGNKIRSNNYKYKPKSKLATASKDRNSAGQQKLGRSSGG